MSPSEAARHAALFVDRQDLGTLVVTGPDRASWLGGIVTCDVADLRPGEGRWGLLLTKPGKILADLAVVTGEDALYLGIPKTVLERALDFLSEFLIMEDAALTDEAARFAWSSLHGPEATRVAAELAREFGGWSAGIDWTGLGGAALVVPEAARAALERSVRGRPGVVVATEGDFRALRVERLLPLYGADMDDQRSPHEASIERRAVSWTKGCYLGQEAVCMQEMRGKVKRRLAVLAVESAEVPAPLSKVTGTDGARVGETRSAVRSEVFGGPIALALLSTDASRPGTRLFVGEAPATVVEPR